MKTFEEWKTEQFRLGNLRHSKSNNSIGQVTGKWKGKYTIKKRNAKNIKIGFFITFDEYLQKVYEANLTSPKQISVTGNSSEIYNLARYKDKGPYSVDNCRFITFKENRLERDEHYDISKDMKRIANERVKNGTNPFLWLAKERVKNGTHNFLGGKEVKQRVKDGTHNFLGGELQNRLVKEGTHNFLNILPWNNVNSTKESLEVWKNANLCYKWWINNKVGYRKLKRNFNFQSLIACQNVIKKFKEGWTPTQDKEWLEFKQKNL